MKSFQDRILKDFDVKQETGKNGKVKNVYVYKGKYAAWDRPKEELAHYRRLYLSAGILLVFCFAWAAFQDVPVNASKPGGFFTLLSLAALLFFGMGLWQFARAEEIMYLRDLKLMQDKLLWGGMLYFLVQAGDAVSGIVYLVKEGVSALAVLVMLAYGVSAALALVIFLAQKKLTYKIVADPSPKVRKIKDKVWK